MRSRLCTLLILKGEYLGRESRNLKGRSNQVHSVAASLNDGTVVVIPRHYVY